LIGAAVLATALAKPLNIVTLDVARRFHSLSTLRYLIRCCELAKVPYLQLHLTDDQNWMFPSKLVPSVEKLNQHRKPAYSVSELRELQSFGKKRGVTLIPEIDLPGHSSILVRFDPKTFGINGRGNCINFASPEVREFSKALLKEVSEVFIDSPYINIGGDEANYSELTLDPAFSHQKAKQGDSWTTGQSFVDFVSSLCETVIQCRKTPLLWEGFAPSKYAKSRIPKKAIVVAWEGDYYPAEQLVRDGFSVINAGWDPFYVVNHYPYDSYTLAPLPMLFGADRHKFGTFRASKVPLTTSRGSMLCWWEGWEWNAQRYLPLRIMAFGHSGARAEYGSFLKTSMARLSKLDREVFPFNVTSQGKCELAPDCFTKSLSLEVSPLDPKVQIAMRTDGEIPTISDLARTVTLNKTTVIAIQAFKNGRALGETMFKQFSKVSEKRNLAFGATVRATTVEDPQFPLSCLTDGVADRVGGFWLGYPNPATVTVELDRAQVANRVEVVPFWASGDRTRYKVSVQSETGPWEQVGDSSERSGVLDSNGEGFEFRERGVRRIRLDVSSSTQYPASIARIHEIRLF
jgi:hexosaminidase